MLIKIRQAKGNKDRYTTLNQSVLNNLRKYYKMYLPKLYLFESIEPEKKISATSVLKIVTQAAKKAKINQYIHIY